MPTYNVNLPNGRTGVLDGDRPFASSGGDHGLTIVDGSGVSAGANFGDETASLVFANNADGQAAMNELITAGNNSPEATAQTTITGTAQVGQTLTANPSITGDPAPALTYQWFADGVAIDGATASTYTLQAAQQGAAVSVEVNATNTHGSTSDTSAATAAVAAAV